MARGVKVSLMLDIDSQDESRMIDDLVNMGMLGVPAPSCANERISVFASSHVSAPRMKPSPQIGTQLLGAPTQL